jgi:hypothetical protein
MTRMKVSLTLLNLSLLAVFLPSSAIAQKYAHVTEVTVEAEPTTYEGPCPKTIRLTGVISVDRGGLVKYHWTHSDGKHRPPVTITLGRPEAYTVHDTWTIGSASTPFHYNGWVRLQMMASSSRYAKVTFTVSCVPRGSQKK